MSRQSENSAPVFESLDAFRGIGALFVLWVHAMGYLWPSTPLVPSSMGVDLFFLLSGFVIAYVYEPKFSSGMGAGDFMRQRIVRLYPLYLLGLLFGAVVLLPGMLGEGEGLRWLAAFLPELVMAPSIPIHGDNEYLFLMNGPAWTLFFELWVNLLYFALFRWLTTARLVGLVAVSVAMMWAASHYFGTMNLGTEWDDAIGGFPRSMSGFFTGVLIYRIARSPAAPTGPRTWWGLAPIVLGLGMCFVPQTLGWPMWAELMLLTFAAPFFIWWAQGTQLPELVRKPLLKLGSMSFAIYILHFPLLEIALRIDWRTDYIMREWAPWPGFVIFAIVLTMAYVVDTWIDPPMRKWLNLRLRGLQKSIEAKRAARATELSSRHR